MMRALRKAAVTVGLKKDDDQDATDKKRIADLKDANEAVKRNLNAFLKSLQDNNNHAVTLFESLSEVYPANQEFAAKLDTLTSKSEHFKTAKAQVEEATKKVEEAYTAVAALQTKLAKMADERASHRQDIKHYEEKIPGLQAKATTNPKEQPRLEENQKKLEESKNKFNAADAALVPELEKLDSDVAGATSSAFREFLEAAAKFSEASAVVVRSALAATESPAPAAEPAPAAAQ